MPDQKTTVTTPAAVKPPGHAEAHSQQNDLTQRTRSARGEETTGAKGSGEEPACGGKQSRRAR